MSELSDQDMADAFDAVEAAMRGRRGGLVPDIPGGGARAWGEADGYWISMHVEPVIDALIRLGWAPLSKTNAATTLHTFTSAQLDQIRADAWDEGYKSGANDYGRGNPHGRSYLTTPNPYGLEGDKR